MNIKSRFVNLNLPVEEIKEKMISTKKARYYYDRDGKEKTTKC